jgi:hypothetical protein
VHLDGVEPHRGSHAVGRSAREVCASADADIEKDGTPRCVSKAIRVEYAYKVGDKGVH